MQRQGTDPLGAYLIRRLMANHMLIEMDHLSEWARESVLRMAKRRRYPSSPATPGPAAIGPRTSWRSTRSADGRRQGRHGARARGENRDLKRVPERRHFFGVGLGTDTGGFSSLPGPRPDAAQSPLSYPFRSYDCNVTFQRRADRHPHLRPQHRRRRPLRPDRRSPGRHAAARRRAAMRSLFRSAEAYLQMWRLAYAR